VSDLARGVDFGWIYMGERLLKLLIHSSNLGVSGNNEIDELVKNVISSLSCKYASFENKSTGTN